MTTSTLPIRIAFPAVPQPQVPVAFVVSAVAHIALFALVAWLIRGMPEVTFPAHATKSSQLVATLVAPVSEARQLQMLQAQVPAPDPMPPLDLPVPTDTTPAPPSRAEETPTLRTDLPGLSIDPARTIIDEPFAAVGRIVNSVGNGRTQFGPYIADQMQRRFPVPASRVPIPVGAVPALYPARAAREGRSQQLSALLMIDASGVVTEARVLPDDPPFVQAVIAAVKGARFTPAERDGKPVPYWAVLEFTFTVDGPTGIRGERLN